MFCCTVLSHESSTAASARTGEDERTTAIGGSGRKAIIATSIPKRINAEAQASALARRHVESAPSGCAWGSLLVVRIQQSLIFCSRNEDSLPSNKQIVTLSGQLERLQPTESHFIECDAESASWVLAFRELRQPIGFPAAIRGHSQGGCHTNYGLQMVCF
jgi:hypothetical protein